jgi:hypothetical protein
MNRARDECSLPLSVPSCDTNCLILNYLTPNFKIEEWRSYRIEDFSRYSKKSYDEIVSSHDIKTYKKKCDNIQLCLHCNNILYDQCFKLNVLRHIPNLIDNAQFFEIFRIYFNTINVDSKSVRDYELLKTSTHKFIRSIERFFDDNPDLLSIDQNQFEAVLDYLREISEYRLHPIRAFDRCSQVAKLLFRALTSRN